MVWIDYRTALPEPVVVLFRAALEPVVCNVCAPVVVLASLVWLDQ